MKRIVPIIFMAFVATFFVSCDSVKKVLATDLEEEDFIIGQLYEDELVNEPLYVPPADKVGPSCPPGSAFDVARCGGSNMKLYDAIQPWMGTPYKYGGTDRNGVDCSAFVGSVYKTTYGITLQRVSRDIQNEVQLIPRDKLQEGDILFFVNSKGKVSHVGIYLHDGMFAHSSTSNGVSISTLDNKYWSQHFFKGGRHLKKK